MRSWRSCASIDKVAIGRASSLRKDIAEALIIHEPELFIESAKHSMRERVLCIDAIDLLLSGDKVQAIKNARNAYGNGLKETKDAIDIIQHLLFKMGIAPHDYDIQNSVTVASEILVNHIISHNDRFDWITLEEI